MFYFGVSYAHVCVVYFEYFGEQLAILYRNWTVFLYILLSTVLVSGTHNDNVVTKVY